MRISQFEAAEADMLLKASAILSIVNLAAAGVLTSVERLTSPNKVSETVSLDYGTFTGLKDTTNSVFAFKGVRFADAPVGNLRWRAPVSPPSKNLGKVDATQFRAACVGATQSSVTSGTSEDCLFGNIYVPFTNSTQPLPVLVYFHGGGFQGGNSHDLPTAVWKDTSATPVIYVSFEYRLGALGFLAGSRLKADGVLNVGLIDQRTALRWVQRYIGNFGGDKSRVTIWGQSAGAGSTMFHLLGNGGNTEGLFRAAMGDSPSLNFQPEGTDDYAEGIFSQYASFANCPSTDAKVLDCLRSADINTLLSASVKFLATRPSVLYNFAPLVDGTYIKERAVEAFLGGRFARIPVLFGSNSDEGAGWSNGLPDPSANTSQANANETTVYNFLKGQYATFTNASVTKAFELYPLSDYSNSVSRQAQQMYGETRYICTAAMITGSATAVGQTAYQYHYNNPISGSTHSAELTAFFSSTTPSDPNNQALYTAMRQYYTSFVANGKPVAKNGVAWTPVSTTAGSSTAGAPRLLLQPGGIAMETLGSLADRCKFWHSLSGEMHT